jgi:hypothetical protein
LLVDRSTASICFRRSSTAVRIARPPITTIIGDWTRRSRSFRSIQRGRIIYPMVPLWPLLVVATGMLFGCLAPWLFRLPLVLFLALPKFWAHLLLILATTSSDFQPDARSVFGFTISPHH